MIFRLNAESKAQVILQIFVARINNDTVIETMELLHNRIVQNINITATSTVTHAGVK